MKARYTLAALLLTAIATTQASASVLSASNPTGRVRDRVDYMNVTTVQNELNTSLKEMTDATAAPGPMSSSGPAFGSTGGFLVDSNLDATENGLDIGTGAIGVSGGIGGQWSLGSGTGASLFGGSNGGNHGNSNGGGSGRGGNRGGGGGDRKGGAQAAPEPSTWMLLGTGLVMIGLYAGMRRRQTVSV